VPGWKLVAAERLAEIERLRHRITELEDRLDAESLIELKAARRTEFAMPSVPEEDTDTAWGVDPTGLFREKLPALTPAEQRLADSFDR
jgi:hypothetical protein